MNNTTFLIFMYRLVTCCNFATMLSLQHASRKLFILKNQQISLTRVLKVEAAYRPAWTVSLRHRRSVDSVHCRVAEQTVSTLWSSRCCTHLSLHLTPTICRCVEQTAGSTSAPGGTITGGHWTGLVVVGCRTVTAVTVSVRHRRPDDECKASK